MKKIIVIVGLILSFTLVSSLAFAGEIKVNVNQEKNEGQKTKENVNIDFDEQDFNNAKGNGGPMIGFLNLNFDRLNQDLINAGFAGFDDENMILYGGGGLGGLKKGSRFGGYGLAGKLTTTNGSKTATINIGYGGFLYEKGVLASQKTKTDLSFGLLMGGGSAELKLIYNNLENDFGDVIASPQMNILTKEFVLLKPQINLHQQLGAFIGLDLSYGYLITYDFGETWKINEKTINGPLDNLQAPSLNLKLSFGF